MHNAAPHRHRVDGDGIKGPGRIYRTKACWIADPACMESVLSCPAGFSISDASQDVYAVLYKTFPNIQLDESETVLSGGVAHHYDAAETTNAILTLCRQLETVT